jgi:hypothetical protein
MTRRRKIAVWTLVGLASLLTLVSSLTVWTKRQLLDTNAWTNTSSEMLADPAIRSAVSNRLVDGLFQRVDVAAELRTQLPPAAQNAAPAIASGLQTAAVRATDAFLTTARAQALWENANRRAHATLVKVLEGKNVRNLTTANGEVVLDIRPLLARIASRLGIEDKLAARASPTTGQIVLLRSDQLAAAQDAVQAFNRLSTFVALAALALYGGAIALARGQRRSVLEVSGASLVVVGLIVLIVQRVAGNQIINSLVKTRANREPIHHAWLLETAMLRDIAVALIVYGVLALVAGWLAGPSRPAVAVRRFLAPMFRRSALIPQGIGLVLFLMFLAWGPNSGSRRLLGIVILAALVSFGIEVLRRQTIREFPGDAAVAPESAYDAAHKPALN